jgi:acyl dehydratase
MSGRYLEDFAVGQTFGSGRLGVDKEQIKAFAAEFDPQPFHLDEDAARDTIFRGLAANGWHTAARANVTESEMIGRKHGARHARLAVGATIDHRAHSGSRI